MRYLLFTVLGIFAFAFIAKNSAYAQVEFLLNGYQDKYFNYDDGPGAKKESSGTDISDKYIYEKPTTKALSHLMWGVGFYNLEDDLAVDEFIRINECAIHEAFSTDEFEWSKVRAATKSFIKENKREFPSRFQFVLPLKLGDYDAKRNAFEIQKDFEVVSIRRFELQATDFNESICSRDNKKNPSTYPRALVLEFSRPFTLTHVPTTEAKANIYIKNKLDLMKKYYEIAHHNKSVMYSLRNAYLVLKVKVFTHGKYLGRNQYNVSMVQMMGILEGYEIYEDIERNNLFFSQSYVKSDSVSSLNVTMQDQYEVLYARSKGAGILHVQ